MANERTGTPSEDVSDQDFMAGLLSGKDQPDEGASPAGEQTVSEGGTEPEQPPRDDKGRFAQKDGQDSPAEQAPSAPSAPKSAEQGQGAGDTIPSWRLREEAEN